MNRLVSHIEFLLHQHSCVIVPNLGGFVVNYIDARKDGLATYLPPSCELVFNRDLKYNDGLLAESYMRVYDVSFDKAMWNIEQDANELLKKLREDGRVELSSLGAFEQTENGGFRYVYGDFVLPSLFGLSKCNLRPLIQIKAINEVPETVGKKIVNMRSVGVVASIAAVIIVMFFLIPASDVSENRQSAQIAYETDWAKPKAKAAADYTDILESTSNMEASEAIVVADDSPRYYVVVGVFTGEKSSGTLLETLKSEGFMDANVLAREDEKRFDVYAASFDNETAADIYLKEVHRKHPAYSDAWVMKR